MIKFTKLRDYANPFDASTIEHSVDAITASEITNEFFYFLQGCGFQKESIVRAFEEVLEENKEEE